MVSLDVSICSCAIVHSGCGSSGGAGSGQRAGVREVLRSPLLAGSVLEHRTVRTLSLQSYVRAKMPRAFVANGSCVAYPLRGTHRVALSHSVPCSGRAIGGPFSDPCVPPKLSSA